MKTPRGLMRDPFMEGDPVFDWLHDGVMLLEQLVALDGFADARAAILRMRPSDLRRVVAQERFLAAYEAAGQSLEGLALLDEIAGILCITSDMDLEELRSFVEELVLEGQSH